MEKKDWEKEITNWADSFYWDFDRQIERDLLMDKFRETIAKAETDAKRDFAAKILESINPYEDGDGDLCVAWNVLEEALSQP